MEAESARSPGEGREQLLQAFTVMVRWVEDHDRPIGGDNATDRTIRALRFLACSTAKDLAPALIEASRDVPDEWRTVRCNPDPYPRELKAAIKRETSRSASHLTEYQAEAARLREALEAIYNDYPDLHGFIHAVLSEESNGSALEAQGNG